MKRHLGIGNEIVRSIPHLLKGRQVVHFMHIGKTGGSAVKGALSPYTITDSYYLVLHGHRFKLRDLPPRHKYIFFLRDPVSRFVSAFNSRLRKGRPRYNVSWRPDEKIAFSQFKTPNELALALFIDDVAQRESAHHAMNCIIHVRSSFWDWFINEKRFLSRARDIFFWGHQETLVKDFELLKERLQLPSTVSLPVDDRDTHRTPAGMDTHLDPLAVENLKRWYARDYEFIALSQSITPDWA